MKAFFGMLCVVCVIIIFLLLAIFYFGIKWPFENDVNAPLNRAQVAAEAEDMLEWMKKAEEGMKRRGMTRGYATIFKHTVDYDYEAIYRSVQNLLIRLERTVEMDKSSQQYQTAMDDIRGTSRELDLRIDEYLLKHYGWWMWLIGIILTIIAVIMGWVAWVHYY